MPTDKIAILITTFLRDNLLIQTLNNILENLPNNAFIIVGDQNWLPNVNKAKDDMYEYIIKNGYGYIVKQDYDIGLSRARNQLVSAAHERGFKYCLLSADSIQFKSKYDLSKYISFLESDYKNGVIGFHLDGSLGNWYSDMKLVPGQFFELSKPKRPLVNGLQPVDIVKNFFLAKTESLLEVKWDENLCLCEHEDFFYRYVNQGFMAFYEPNLQAVHIKDRTDPRYTEMRARFHHYKSILQNKHGITGWVRQY